MHSSGRYVSNIDSILFKSILNFLLWRVLINFHLITSLLCTGYPSKPRDVRLLAEVFNGLDAETDWSHWEEDGVLPCYRCAIIASATTSHSFLPHFILISSSLLLHHFITASVASSFAVSLTS